MPSKIKSLTQTRDAGLPVVGGVEFNDTGLLIFDDISLDDWKGIGRFMNRCEGGVQWWVGDWLNYGDGRKEWGKMYEEAIAATGYDYGSLRNQKTVASEFDLSRRRDNLPWPFHAEVSGLPEVAQERLLNQAEAENWTRAELRKAVKAEKGDDEADPAFDPDEAIEKIYRTVRAIASQWPTENLEMLANVLKSLSDELVENGGLGA